MNPELGDVTALPPGESGRDVRVMLTEAQTADPELGGWIKYKRWVAGGKKGQFQGSIDKYGASDDVKLRISPVDDCLEREVRLAAGLVWVPWIPSGPVPWTAAVEIEPGKKAVPSGVARLSQPRSG